MRSVGEFGAPQFQRVSSLGSVTAGHSSSGRQPNFAALNRGRHLYSAWRPSRWALAHILVAFNFLAISLIMICRPTVDEAGWCYPSAFERTIMYRVVSYLPALPIRDFLRFCGRYKLEYYYYISRE